MTAHPFLIQDVILQMFLMEDIERLWILSGPKVGKAAHEGTRMYRAIKQGIADKGRIQDVNDSTGEDISRPVSNDFGDHNQPILVTRFRKYLRSFKNTGQWLALKDRSLCHWCNCPPDEPWVISCFHLYCKECLHDMATEAAKDGKTQSWCIICDKPFEECKPCSGIEELETDIVLSMDFSSRKDRPTRKKNQKEPERWLDLPGDVLQSSKTAAVQTQMEEWLKEEPDKKIIVYSQFRMLFVLPRLC